MNKQKILLGCHVGFKAKNYLEDSVKEILSYDGNCFMVFTGPPQNFFRKSIDLTIVKKAHELMKQNNIDLKNIVVHAPYLINLASPKKETREIGLKQLIVEIERCELIGSSLLVLHPGSSLNLIKDDAIEFLILNLNKAIEMTSNKNVVICIETMSGKGSEIGTNFLEIQKIISGVKDKTRIGVCLDTCHMHESGIDISNSDQVLDNFLNFLSLDYIKVIHLNDSKNEIGAKKDRHENIGYGKIGFETLCSWVHNDRLSLVPKILETPYRENKPIYKDEISFLKNKKFIKS